MHSSALAPHKILALLALLMGMSLFLHSMEDSTQNPQNEELTKRLSDKKSEKVTPDHSTNGIKAATSPQINHCKQIYLPIAAGLAIMVLYALFVQLAFPDRCSS